MSESLPDTWFYESYKVWPITFIKRPWKLNIFINFANSTILWTIVYCFLHCKKIFKLPRLCLYLILHCLHSFSPATSSPVIWGLATAIWKKLNGNLNLKFSSFKLWECRKRVHCNFNNYIDLLQELQDNVSSVVNCTSIVQG